MGRLSGRGPRALALLVVVLLAGSGPAYGADEKPAGSQAKANVQITMVGVEYEGTKLWVPGTIVAHKGDRVKVNLINKIPSDPAQHGFAIDAFKVSEIVNRGETKSTEFVADKAGIFPVYCQLHPAHVGGQLVVLP